MGCELEFFLLREDNSLPLEINLEERIAELKAELMQKLPAIYQVEKEMGASQIEVKTKPISDLSALCDHITQAKIIIHQYAQNKGLIASFAAQPFKDDCGNALQCNISWQDHDEQDFNQATASLLKYTNQMLPLLASKAEDFQRFDVALNKALHQKGKYVAPTYLAYGKDNRSAAIRLIDSRLEFRVPCADADPYLTIIAVLFALLRGAEEKVKLKNSDQVYGNAFDEQYSFKKITCSSLETPFISELLEILFEVIFDKGDEKNTI